MGALPVVWVEWDQLALVDYSEGSKALLFDSQFRMVRY
jgi:hypothetical protein